MSETGSIKGSGRVHESKAIARGLREEEYPILWKGMFARFPEYYIARYRNDPRSVPEHSRVIEVDGQIVTHVRIYDRDVRVGASVCRVGAIGDVETLEPHRRKGYAAMALNDAIKTMDRYGMDFCTILSGVGVYERTGWSAFHEDEYSVPVEGPAVSPAPGYCVRRVELDLDLVQLMEVHEAYNAERTLSVVRSPAYWRRHFNWASDHPQSFFVAERDGRIAAFVRSSVGGDTLTILEACHLPGDEAAMASLFEVLVRYAKRRRATCVRGVLPTDHPLIGLFSARGGMEHTRPKVLLLRLVNLNRFLARIRPALQKRLTDLEEQGKVDPDDPRTDLDLAITVAGQSGRLQIRRGVVRSFGRPGEDGRNPHVAGSGEPALLDLSQESFFELLLGMRRASELGLGGAMEPSGIELLDYLMYGQRPIYWRIDGV